MISASNTDRKQLDKDHEKTKFGFKITVFSKQLNTQKIEFLIIFFNFFVLLSIKPASTKLR